MSAASGLPVTLRLDENPALVVGRGRLGYEKAASVVAHGARVLRVDPTVIDAPAGVRREVRRLPSSALDDGWRLLTRPRQRAAMHAGEAAS
jgi:siroheme synthase (precorrin-2 oxidase/ferrochelatase)